MATSPAPDFCAQRGMPFAPSNGVAAKQRVETKIVEARKLQEEAEREERRWKRTSRGKR